MARINFRRNIYASRQASLKAAGTSSTEGLGNTGKRFSDALVFSAFAISVSRLVKAPSQ